MRFSSSALERAQKLAAAPAIRALLDGEPDRSKVLRHACAIGLSRLEELAAAGEPRRAVSSAAVELKKWRVAQRPHLSARRAGARLNLGHTAWSAYECGERVPLPRERERLEELTAGAVKAADWPS